MYCRICHKENPDNFDTCIYCGTSLAPEKKAGFLKSRNSLSEKITPVRVFTAFFALCLLFFVVFSITAVVKKEHPERIAETYAAAVASGDAAVYAALYDSEYIRFQIDFSYYEKKKLDAALKEELGKMTSFYTEKCGKGYTVDCEVPEIAYADQEHLTKIQAYYAQKMKYENAVEAAAKLKVVLNADGKDGAYQTVLPDFMVLKIGGLWYRAGGCPESLVW